MSIYNWTIYLLSFWLFSKIQKDTRSFAFITDEFKSLRIVASLIAEHDGEIRVVALNTLEMAKNYLAFS